MNGHILMSTVDHPSIYVMLQVSEMHDLDIVVEPEMCTGGKWLFLVSCSSIVSKEIRDRYTHTLVVHASDLPKGRGWSPWIHELRKGATEICMTLLEAEDKVDTGRIWNKAWASIEPHWLYEDIADAIAIWTAELIHMAIRGECLQPKEQEGKSTKYRKLTEEDSRIEITKEQWDVIRTCDPERFPPWFKVGDNRYGIDVYPIGAYE